MVGRALPYNEEGSIFGTIIAWCLRSCAKELVSLKPGLHTFDRICNIKLEVDELPCRATVCSRRGNVSCTCPVQPYCVQSTQSP